MGFDKPQVIADLLAGFENLAEDKTAVDAATEVGEAVVDNYTPTDPPDLTDYAKLIGRSGGQVLNGGTGDGEDLELISTAHANKGDIKIGGLTADKDGDVGIGTVAPGYRLDVLDSLSGYAVRVRNDLAAEGGHVFTTRMGKDNGSGTTYLFKVCDGNGTVTGYLQTIAGVFQLSDVSDEKMKSDIADTKISGLGTIGQITLKEYRYTRQGPGAHMHPIGFIAQDLLKAFPDAVSEDEGGLLTTSRSALIPVLCKAVQELAEQNKSLLARVEALESIR